MQQILSVWSTLDARRRIIVIGATLAMFAAVLGLSRMAAQPSMSLLYAGLESAAAGDVIASLDQQGVIYDVREGAIFVESGRRDALRLTLAAEGLPANNGQGYELLDSLSGFGTTSQMFDAAYWRAKEGELARTIIANPQIKAARVHISNPTSNPFQRNLKPTASVSVTTTSGGLAGGHAQALKYLVASAVAGLAPEDVSVIDGRGGLVLSGDEQGIDLAGGEDRAAEFRNNIQRILEARVGYGNSVVEVTVETVTEREAIMERRFDPENRVAISSETEERSNSSSGTQGGAVTVASNLPDGDAAGGENSSRAENTETRERVNYEVSETTREILRSPGAIKRVSVAVLVDGLRTVDPASGEETWQPRSEEELADLRELVASAVGFDVDRGDEITLKSLEFEPVESELPAEIPSFLGALNLDAMSLIQLGVLAFVALALGLFVVRPILAAGKQEPLAAIAGPTGSARAQLGQPGMMQAIAGQNQQVAGLPMAMDQQGLAMQGAPGAAGAGAGTNLPATLDPLQPNAPQALTGEIDDGIGILPALGMVSPEEMMSNNFLPEGAEDPNIDPIERLRKLIEERREETVEVLRNWIEDEQETV